MMGASIETTLELWASSLREVKSRKAATEEGIAVGSKTGVCRTDQAGAEAPGLEPR